ncbi:MAG: hypothetical protein VYD19_05495 [Myxococcota bacterium]|nr:hypothetical protein [Myxococcota bacterium]
MKIEKRLRQLPSPLSRSGDLDPELSTILAAVDGHQLVEELAVRLSSPPEALLARLDSLVERGAIVWAAGGASLPQWFQVEDEQDRATLDAFGIWGRIPARPERLPGLGRYGRFPFDQRQLLERAEIPVSLKREVLFLSQRLHQVDHFEYLDTEVDASERTLRKAWFAFSRRLHPDTLFEKSLGSFEMAARIAYQMGQQIYDILTGNAEFAEAYARQVSARDLAFRAQLETERSARRSARRPRGRESAESMRAAQEQREREAAAREERKASLRARLSHNQARVKEKSKAGELDRERQARRFVAMGREALRKGRGARAYNQFRLALNQAPSLAEAQQGLRQAQRVVDGKKSESLWERGEEIAARNLEKALPFFKEALELSCDQERMLTLIARLGEAELQVKHGALCRDLLELAVRSAPTSLDLRWALLQHYTRLGERELAMESCAEILKIDPSEPRAMSYQRQHQIQGQTGEWQRVRAEASSQMAASHEVLKEVSPSQEVEVTSSNQLTPPLKGPLSFDDFTALAGDAELEVVYNEAQLNQSAVARGQQQKQAQEREEESF